MNRRDLFKLAAGAAVVPLALHHKPAPVQHDQVMHDEEEEDFADSAAVNQYREEFIRGFEQRQSLLRDLVIAQ